MDDLTIFKNALEKLQSKLSTPVNYDEEVRLFDEFWNSEEGDAARELLKLASKTISLGRDGYKECILSHHGIRFVMPFGNVLDGEKDVASALSYFYTSNYSPWDDFLSYIRRKLRALAKEILGE